MKKNESIGTVFVDADACPVLEEIIAVVRRFDLRLKFVANRTLKKYEQRDGIETVQTGQEFNAADHWILNQVREIDFVVTADLELARSVIKKKCRVCGWKGEPFTAGNIADAIAKRNLLMTRLELDFLNESKKRKKKVDQNFKSKFKGQFHNYLTQEVS